MSVAVQTLTLNQASWRRGGGEEGPFSTAGGSKGIFIYCVLTIIIYSISTRDHAGNGVTVWRTKAVEINLNPCP